MTTIQPPIAPTAAQPKRGDLRVHPYFGTLKLLHPDRLSPDASEWVCEQVALDDDSRLVLPLSSLQTIGID